MRSLLTVVVGFTLAASLWSGGPAPAFADDNPNGQGWCDPSGSFAPGASLGPVRLGIPLGQISQWYGRPTLVENRPMRGHQWTHMRFNGLDVLGRDNVVAALNVLQSWPVRIPQHCLNQGIIPFNLPIGYVQRTYGPPVVNALVSGLQYWLYNKLGLLVTVPPGGAYVQGLTVYQAGQFCALAPTLASFGGFGLNAATALQCP
ncbi:MAG: hypothetical protein ACYDAB_13890 [bacterium]